MTITRQMVTGHVVQISDDEVLVDIGYKSEGVIPFRAGFALGPIHQDVIKCGDEIPGGCDQVEDEGNVQLSKAPMPSRLGRLRGSSPDRSSH